MFARPRLTGILFGLLVCLLAELASAQTIRVATFSTELGRRGPGLLLRDLTGDKAQPDIDAVVAMIAEIAPDIIALQGIDHDPDGHALRALAARLAEAGPNYPYRYAGPSNAGVPTGLDIDGDGYLGGPRDAQGYGAFYGAGGMAVLSRWPIGAVTTLSERLWRDLPGAIPPEDDPALEVQRLSSNAHWIVPIETPSGSLSLLTWHATPPVFDGPEDRNGRRNHDEAAIWRLLLDGHPSLPAIASPFVLAGNANLDPNDGDGRPAAMEALLGHPRLGDLRPTSRGGTLAGDPDHSGDPGLDTADFDDPPGNLRVSYLLPSRDITPRAAGIFWPPPAEAPAALGPPEHWPRHRIVWADLDLTAP